MMDLASYDEKIVNALEMLSGKDIDGALDAAEQAVDQDPLKSEAYYVLGLVAERRGDRGLAMEFVRRAHAIDPDRREYADALAVLHAGIGQLNESLYYAKLAVALQPHPTITTLLPNDFGSVPMAMARARASDHGVYAVMAYSRGELERAATEAEMELRINPRNLDIELLLVRILLEQGKFTTAKGFLQSAVHQAPNHAEIRALLGDALLGCGQHADAEAAYGAALRLAGDAPNVLGRVAAGYARLGHPSPACQAAYDAWTAVKPARRRGRPTVNINNPDIFVGIISDELREGPQASFLLPLLRAKAPGIKFIVYQLNRRVDPVTAQMRGSALRWREIYDLDDATAARIIVNDENCAILDLTVGENARVSLLKAGLAPLNCRWSNFLPPHGAAGADLVIGSPATAEVDERFGLTTLSLPSLMPYEFRCSIPEAPIPGPLPADDSGVMTFGGYGDLARMTPQTIALWARVLEKVPGSRLFLGYATPAGDGMRERIMEMVSHHGLMTRVFLQDSQAADRKLAFFATIDVLLDTVPVSGDVDIADALWMGVPAVTLAGATRAGQIGSAILHAADCRDWISADEDGFVERAVALASQPAELAQWRRDLRERVASSPLTNADAFAAALATAIRGRLADALAGG